MVQRDLTSDEEALWASLTQSVRPLRKSKRLPVVSVSVIREEAAARLTASPLPRPASTLSPTPTATLDAGWDRKIRNGKLSPDMSIDLHGHSLAAAHGRLNQALAAAWSRDVRVLLVITGKPPKIASVGGASRRGAIRGEISHWLETSSYADRIASVRIAHQRHGGDGALYVILRRKK